MKSLEKLVLLCFSVAVIVDRAWD